MFNYQRFSLDKNFNRGLPANTHISLNVRWPLLFFPIALLSQLLTPHPLWVILLVVVMGLYGIGYLWVRALALNITLSRERHGTLLVAGDLLEEELVLGNASIFPILWAEFVDHSDVPEYNLSQVVACGGSSHYRWRTKAVCKRRGLYQLGPHELFLSDPFGLFSLNRQFPETDTVLIYPRVVELPPIALPHGYTRGSARHRRPLLGTMRAASVRDYLPGDSLRTIHWPSTARRGQLTVTEQDIEPSGDVWIILDVNSAVHQGEGQNSTLEQSIIVAASVASALINSGERRAVGLALATQAEPQKSTFSQKLSDSQDRLTMLPPQPGQAQFWQIMSTLAPVEAAGLSLAKLLRSSREALGRGRMLIVITPQQELTNAKTDEHPEINEDWSAELVHLQSTGIMSSVVLITAAPDAQPVVNEASPSALRALLAQQDIPLQEMQTGQPLKALLTYRRTRRVIRNTPTGGAVAYEIEEEVG